MTGISWATVLQFVMAISCIGLFVYIVRWIWDNIEDTREDYFSSRKRESCVDTTDYSTVGQEPVVRNRWQVQLLADENGATEQLLEGVNYLTEDVILQDNIVYFNSDTEAFFIPVRNIKYIKFIGDFTAKNAAMAQSS